MDDTNEIVKVAMKVIHPYTLRAQQAVHGEAGLRLEERCEGVECGKPARDRRIGVLANPVRRLLASLLWGCLWTEGGTGHPCWKGGEGRGCRGEGLGGGFLERMLCGCQ